MEVKNLAWNEIISKRCYHPLLPQVIRGLIIGKCGCGKTTLVINFLLRPGWLDYNNINIFSKSLFQPEYRILKKAFKETLSNEVIIGLFENQNEIKDLGISPISFVEEMAKEIRDKSDVECNFYQSVEDVPEPRELSSEKNNLMVFDDLLFEKQKHLRIVIFRGRHSNVDCFHLAQKYFKLPRQTIRMNANFICMFPQDFKNLNHIFDDQVGSDLTVEEYRQLYKTTWKKQHRFVIIDLSSKQHNGKYRSGIDEFYILN